MEKQEVESVSLTELSIKKFLEAKEVSTKYFSQAKEFVKEKPLLGLAGICSVGFFCMPLLFVTGILLTLSIVFLSIFSFVMGTMTLVFGTILFFPASITVVTAFLYYSAFFIIINTTKKINVWVASNKETGVRLSLNIIKDCLNKTVAEYVNQVKSNLSSIGQIIVSYVQYIKAKVLELIAKLNLDGKLGQVKAKREVLTSKLNHVKEDAMGRLSAIKEAAKNPSLVNSSVKNEEIPEKSETEKKEE